MVSDRIGGIMKIKLGTKLELPLSQEQKKFAEFKVTNFAFYGNYASFDGRKTLEYNTSFLSKLKWLFTNKPIMLKQQVGVRLERNK